MVQCLTLLPLLLVAASASALTPADVCPPYILDLPSSNPAFRLNPANSTQPSYSHVICWYGTGGAGLLPQLRIDVTWLETFLADRRLLPGTCVALDSRRAMANVSGKQAVAVWQGSQVGAGRQTAEAALAQVAGSALPCPTEEPLVWPSGNVTVSIEHPQVIHGYGSPQLYCRWTQVFTNSGDEPVIIQKVTVAQRIPARPGPEHNRDFTFGMDLRVPPRTTIRRPGEMSFTSSTEGIRVLIEKGGMLWANFRYVGVIVTRANSTFPTDVQTTFSAIRCP